MAIALRFLKETRLLPFWIKYVREETDSGKKYKTYHWSEKECVDLIFGCTSFTGFVAKQLRDKYNECFQEGTPIYLRFVYWLKELGLIDKYKIYPPTLNSLPPNNAYNLDDIIIDKKRKKTTVTFKTVKDKVICLQ